MRRFMTLLGAAALGMGLMAGPAIAAGNVTLTLDPAASVVAGNSIAIELTSTTSDGNHLQVFVCYLLDDAEPPAPILSMPLPSADCGGSSPTGRWVLQKQAAPGAPLVDSYPTTGLAGRTVGFLGQHVPVQGNPLSKAYGDVQVVAPTVVTERHAGCNGIENAVTKVKPNGKAEAKLMEIAERFDCNV